MINCKKPFILIYFSLFTFSILHAQKKNSNLVYIDKHGVLRYTATKMPADFFGVNYTTPFAHAYRAHKALNLDIEKAIQNDVYHFSRLGFDAFRVHVWDTEISDSAGNLLQNEHLRLFDFLLAELRKRKIRTIITPIAFWGNGYPEQDEPTPGFSRYFGRSKLTSNDTAIRAQENYLKQFFTHVNPYTKLTYQDDPDIIAVELNNEPSHSNPKKSVTDYINRLAAAVKSTGFTKPLFYNISQGPYFSDAVAASEVNGFSFQWYPSGLVGNQTLKGNTLPNVDVYHIPFRDTVPAFKNKALMVYEYDAADIMASYMYPFMAKAFRQAGFQWATQFAYDPLAIANVNTEYQTHYLNLAYTPSKAISMLIASEVFHRLPLSKDFGRYPADSSFDVFRVSYVNELSEMNSVDKFYYSNNTTTQPVKVSELKHIAGVGSSTIVQYEGTGAYFLDKVSPGAWVLELMPDVVYTRDPFERASPQKEVTRIEWKKNKMIFSLEEFGKEFSVTPVNENNSYSTTNGENNADGFYITPGKYLLTRKNSSFTYTGSKEFVAPAASQRKEIVVRHQPPTEVSAGNSFFIKAIIGGIDNAKVTVQLTKLGGGLFRNLTMQKKGTMYMAEIPSDLVTTGQLQYRIIVQNGNNYITYPGAFTGDPFVWDNYNFETYKTNIASPSASVDLYNPSTDRTVHVLPNFRRGFQTSYISGNSSGSLVYKLTITDLKNDEVMGMQLYTGDKLAQRKTELSSFNKMVLRARSGDSIPVTINLKLVNTQGDAFGASVLLTKDVKEMVIPFSMLKPDSSLLMPRPYPGFQPVYFKSSVANPLFDLSTIEKLEITLTNAMQQTPLKKYEIQIESVRLDK